MKVALLANSASSLWPFTDCRASWSTRHGSTCAVMPAASAEVGYGRVNCAPPVDESTGGAQWIKNVDFFFFSNPLFGFLLPVWGVTWVRRSPGCGGPASVCACCCTVPSPPGRRYQAVLSASQPQDSLRALGKKNIPNESKTTSPLSLF